MRNKKVYMMVVIIGVSMFFSACGKEKNTGKGQSSTKMSTTVESVTSEKEETTDNIEAKRSLDGFYNCTQMDHNFVRVDFEIKTTQEGIKAIFYAQYTEVNMYEYGLVFTGTKLSDDTYEFVSDDIKYNVVWDGKDKLTISGDEFGGTYERSERDGYGEGDYMELDILTFEADENVESGIEIDKTLANAIRSEFGYSEDQILTYQDLENVTYLAPWHQEITSLKGISLLKNLQEIHINNGYIEDISEIAKLKEIRFIDITNCYIKEIPNLSKCSTLESLYLNGNMIEDISPVANVKSLKYVSLDNNFIRSIKPLKNVDFLETLIIDSNCILDYSSIKDSRSLITAYDNGAQGSYEQALELENHVKEIVDSFPKGLSELELEKLVYKYVKDNMYYSEDIKEPSVYGYDAIMNGWGVCGDYSEAFALIANHAGIETYNCSSENHAWNIVKIDGVYYHCDALWDEDVAEWNYFNKSTGYIYNIEDHMHNLRRYPICEVSMSVLEYMDCFER